MVAIRHATAVMRRRSYISIVLVVAVLLVASAVGLDVYWLRQIETIAIYTMVVSGLNLTFGYAGELALGQVAVLAAGAYTTAILAQHGVRELSVAIVTSVVSAMVIGLVTGVPGLRLGHWTLALVSFFVLLLIPNVVQVFQSQTGGAVGLAGILDPTLFGADLGIHAFFALCVIVTGLWLWGVRNLVQSGFGVALQAMRERPVLAESLGVGVRRLKLSAYVTGSVPAGIAGCLYAYSIGYVAPSEFTFNLAVILLAASILGGPSSVYGAPLGSALLVLGPLNAASFQRYSSLVFGLFLVVAALLLQGGLAQLLNRMIARRWPAPITRPKASVGAPSHKDTYENMHEDADQQTPARNPATLRLRTVEVSFGGVDVLRKVDLEAAPGRVTGLIGANGAGKTTLLNVISGYVRANAGSVTVGEEVLTRLAPRQIADHGIARTFQTPIIQRHATVLEIAASGSLGRAAPGLLANMFRLSSYRRWRVESMARAWDALELTGLTDVAAQAATELPLGQRRLLEVARAIVREPSYLLLDEPAAGVDDAALERLRTVVERLCERGTGVILVEHNVPFVLGLAEHVVVLDFGRVIAAGPADEVKRHDAVIRSYLGGGPTAAGRAPAAILSKNPGRL